MVREWQPSTMHYSGSAVAGEEAECACRVCVWRWFVWAVFVKSVQTHSFLVILGSEQEEKKKATVFSMHVILLFSIFISAISFALRAKWHPAVEQYKLEVFDHTLPLK